jgi:hypothetical protein
MVKDSRQGREKDDHRQNLKGKDKADFFNIHEVTKDEARTRLSKTNQLLGTPANPIENFMSHPGAQNHQGKKKLKTNAPENDFV